MFAIGCLPVIGANPGGCIPPNNPAAPPPRYFSWMWKNFHTMYSKPTQPRRISANYADSVEQISSASVRSIFR